MQKDIEIADISLVALTLIRHMYCLNIIVATSIIPFVTHSIREHGSCSLSLETVGAAHSAERYAACYR